VLDEQSKPISPEELYRRLYKRAHQLIEDSYKQIEGTLRLLEESREIIARHRSARWPR
jgi:hypothetical protein